MIGDAWSTDVVLKVNAPSAEEIRRLGDGVTLAGEIAPAQHPELLDALSQRSVTVLALDAVPRISRATSMDVLSSMENIAGYRAVIEAARAIGRFFTGQVTAAGGVPPSQGAGRRRGRGRARGDRRGLQPGRHRARDRPAAGGR